MEKSKKSSGIAQEDHPEKITKKAPITLTLNNTPKGQAIAQIAQSKYHAGFKKLIGSSKKAKTAALKVVGDIIRDELKKYVTKCRQQADNNSVDELLNFTWCNYLDDVQETCPSLVDILTACVTRKYKHKEMTKKKGKKVISLVPVIGTLFSLIGFSRSKKCNVFQKFNSVMLWLGGAKRKVFNAFHQLGWCQGIDGTRAGIDRIRQEYDTKVIQWRDKTTEQLGEEEALNLSGDLPALDDVWDDVDGEDSDEEATDPTESDPSISTETNGSDEPDSTAVDDELNSEADEPDNVTVVGDGRTDSVSDSGDDGSIPLYDINVSYHFDITFDNVNQKVGVRHHTRGKENTVLNMVQAYATRERIFVPGLSYEMPSADTIRNIPLDAYVPSAEEETQLKEELSVMVTRILCTYLDCFKNLNVDWSIPHAYSKESCWKSEIVPLGIIRKDETKTAEMIDILDSYRQYVPHDADGDPVPLLLYCDGLSCERVDGAQKARINGRDKWTRLEMFQPCIQEWHRRLMFLQDTYDELFKFESHREKGTLYNIKQLFDHKGVSSNIMECFNKAEEMLELATEGYTIVAALDVLGIKTISDIPPQFPTDPYGQTTCLTNAAETIVERIYQKPNTNEIHNVVIDKELDKSVYCVCKLDVGGVMLYCNNKDCQHGSWFHIDCLGMFEEDVPEGVWYCSVCKDVENVENINRTTKGKKRATIISSRLFRDLKKEYAEKLLWRGLGDMARHDAVRENDGIRMLLHWKFDTMEFFETNHPKYFIYAHKLLTSVAGGTSEHLQHQMTWNRTVNVNGGKLKNIPKDLYNEFLNKEYKENSRDAGGQLTDATVARHSQMLGVGKGLEKVYHGEVAGKSTALTRKHGQLDRSSDVKRLVQILQPLKLFHHTAGRAFKGFDSLKQYKGVTQPRKFKERVIRLRETMAVKRELQDMN